MRGGVGGKMTGEEGEEERGVGGKMTGEEGEGGGEGEVRGEPE